MNENTVHVRGISPYLHMKKILILNESNLNYNTKLKTNSSKFNSFYNLIVLTEEDIVLGNPNDQYFL